MVFLQIKKVLGFAPTAPVCGIDEVGRGPWAGSLVACALMFPCDVQIRGLRDSKQMTPEKREEVFTVLMKKAIYGVGVVEVAEVDAMGVVKATNTAFIRALEDLAKKGAPKPGFLLVDGRDKLSLPYPFKTIIRGDSKLKLIAAASVIAKVTRDRMMVKLAKKYPQYGFEDHKGYGTEAHHRALKKFGPCAIHRLSYKPVQALRIIPTCSIALSRIKIV